MPATDLDVTDLPLWVKWIGSILVTGGWIWALVRPWRNERWVVAMKQCTPQLDRHLRDKIFAVDLEERATWYAKTEALEDAVKALSASALAQGKILDEWPQFSRILVKLETTMSSLSHTMARVEDRLDKQGSLVDRVVGALEAQQAAAQQQPAPRRKSRGRA